MKKGPPTSRLRRAFDLARVGAQAGAAWATRKGTEAAAEHTAEVLGNLRGMAAKIGQTASYVEGIVPQEQRAAYEKALAALRDKTPASPYAQVEQTLQEDLGQSPAQLFSAFEQAPVASASIGQVHRAQLLDGTPVAVKVQHKGIDKAFEADLKNINMLEGLINLAGPSALQTADLLEEVLLRFRQELNYNIEANNQRAFASLHGSSQFPTIRVPKVHPELSSRHILTTDWADGMSWEQACKQPEPIRRSYAETLWLFVFRGNLVGGAFNADPHPGNYVFSPDGGVNFLDFGCVQPIAESTRQAAVRAHRAVLDGDEDRYEQAIASMLGTRGGAFGKATLNYTRLCFKPVLSQRFCLDANYIKELTQEARTLKQAMRAKDGSFVSPPPHLALMNRLQFGFYSVISRLNVAVDYRAVEESFLAEAESVEQGLIRQQVSRQ